MLERERVVESAALGGRATGRLTNPYVRDEFGLETMDLNVGPQHPAMHGLLRLIVELDGETIVRCDPVMGYLHRCQEKIAENRMYPAVIPLTDRLDYFANMHMEHGYCLAVEDLMGLDIPPRANEIFITRTRGVGKVTQEEAVEMGLTGPPLRSTGVDFDVRRDYPYSWYPNVEFDVITDTEGDAEAAYRVRVGEIKQSIRIVKQVLENVPEGAVMGDVPRRIRPAEGEGFGRVESPRGEFAVHVVSDGSDVPYRVHYRDPSFVNMQFLQEIVPGHYLPDVMPIMGIIDPVSGGWDK